MKLFRTIRNYLCYCGIEKDEYNKVKKAAYVSNFRVWRILHCALIVLFAALSVASRFDGPMAGNGALYLCGLGYSIISTLVFFLAAEDSIFAQLWIYLTVSLLFLLSAFISQNHAEHPATTFIVLLLITPMFMIDKPFFMGIELVAASTVFLVWMRGVKLPEVWQMDVGNTAVFAAVGFFLHVIANSIRIKEFTLTRKINMQKDTDDLTGLKNKGALTREINAYLEDAAKDSGILFILDIDRFKQINDTYGHDVGDDVIAQLGAFLGRYFPGDAIVGRFGGDEFIFFVKDTNDRTTAGKIAREVLAGAAESVKLPDDRQTFGASVGVALYHGQEKNYSELFKKADTALYAVKPDPGKQYKIYEE